MAPAPTAGSLPNPLPVTDEKLATSYNNFYEFGTGKDDPSENAGRRQAVGLPIMQRVVVTGLGLVTPLGSGVDVNWKRLIAGDSGARRIEEFKVDDLTMDHLVPIVRGGSDASRAASLPRRWA